GRPSGPARDHRVRLPFCAAPRSRECSSDIAHVRFWHKADMALASIDVCFRGNSGHWGKSALPPKADIGTQSGNVRFVPKADIEPLIRSPRRLWQGAMTPR